MIFIKWGFLKWCVCGTLKYLGGFKVINIVSAPLDIKITLFFIPLVHSDPQPMVKGVHNVKRTTKYDQPFQISKAGLKLSCHKY